MKDCPINSFDDLKKAIENPRESTTENFGDSKMLREWHEKLKAFKDDITRASITSKLWIQYLYYINVIKKVQSSAYMKLKLASQRSSSDDQLIRSYLYLQNMLELPTSHLWVYISFLEHGYRTERRRNRY
jgi:hypothetical protein